MPKRTITETLDALGDHLLDEFDQIVRAADARFRAYKTEDIIELDRRAQAGVMANMR